MSINIRLFASLREQLGQAETSMNISKPTTVADVWTYISNDKPVPANMLCAINMEYVDLDQQVNDGDEVAFFPPVTGG